MEVISKEKLYTFKDNFFKSKKYWAIYLILILFASLSMFGMENYLNPKMEIATLLVVSLLGVFAITYYFGHDNDKELYKTVFIVILTFGIVCSFLNPISFAPDEVEHFVRSEMTSRGEFFPIYENNSYSTIQSTLDLIKESKVTEESGFDGIFMNNATIFRVDADTEPINYSLVDYPSAFGQNPFFGYLPQAIGMLIAKLFDLNAVWLLWLGRIFNTLLYASLVTVAIKKTPILKVPLFIASIIPLTIFQIASLSIDSMVNGLGILMIAYFFSMYKSPDYSLEINDVIKFSILGLLLGLCKLSFFAFILLILFVPRNKFSNKKYWYYSILSVVFLSVISLLWTKLYANPMFFQSFRSNYWTLKNINSTEQISYMLSHKKDTIIEILRIPHYFDTDLLFNSRSLLFNKFNSPYLMFLGAVCLLYPTKEKFQFFSKAGALFVCLVVYYGTYFILLVTWTPIGQLYEIVGVQPRYFLPLFGLFPFIFGINNNETDEGKINKYLIVIALVFLAIMLISCVVFGYA